ncbi:MAG TPA: glycosyltransferase [Mycobacteriales bacterium]|nr:glycosyltransferase [Mycobacteriales bacterium]
MNAVPRVNMAGGLLGPAFDHLDRLTDRHGLFEHALHSVPRPEHGYCLDDVARGLVVACREPDPGPAVRRLAALYLDFTLAALHSDGSCHNRMRVDGTWTDSPGVGDWWGRALSGLGVAAVRAPSDEMRARALDGFRTAAGRRSPHSRTMAFAALGAGELLIGRPGEQSARVLLRDAADTVSVGVGTGDPAWPWPEPRLRYGNGAVAEALLLAGAALPDPVLLASGLRLLDFLLRIETRDGHLSVTPVGGRGPGDTSPGYDQQAIEVATLADACARAYAVTGDPRWLAGVRLAWAWFLGDNDGGTAMFDPRTGGGYDGLQPRGRNLNQGAESTLAMLSTAQHARHLGGLG